ncbi:ATP-grasp domain-containing protein [Streptomyces sp. NPDC003032]
MQHLVFVDSSVLGLRAMEYAKERGDSVTLLWSRRYDFMHTPASRARSLALADRAIEVGELHDPQAALGALRAAGVATDGIDAVVATLHMLAGPAARLAESTGARGPSPRAVAAARDKAACRRILDERGLPNVRFAEVTGVEAALTEAADIGYPVVVKPVYGVGKNVTTFARSPKDIELHFQEAGARLDGLEHGFAVDLDDRYIVEEVAVGPLYSVEVATDGATCTALVTVRRKLGLGNPVLELGSTVPCGLSPAAERELGDYAVDVCRALGLDLGLFHVEVIGTADGFRLVEVNPRIAGGTVPDVIRAATGRDLFEVLVDLYDGEPLSPDPFPVETAASHTFLAAVEDCVVRDDLPTDWFEAFRPRLHSGSSSIGPGSRLLGMEGNTTTYGVIRVVARDAVRAEAACTEPRAEISELLGFPMVPLAPGLVEACS